MTSEVTPELFASVPDQNGRFGRFGGKFVAETLMSALSDLEQLYQRLKDDAAFQREFDEDLAHYVGRPSPLYEAARLSDAIGGARILLKREDLNHTGAHKVNNTIGQALLAKHMGKKRVIAETGAGQHGVASATVAARLRFRVPRIYGRGGYSQTSAQCVSNEALGCAGCLRDLGFTDFERRHERSHA